MAYQWVDREPAFVARRYDRIAGLIGLFDWVFCFPPHLRGLAAKHRRHVLVVPVSFGSDHVETLYEIDIEYREQALRLGIDDYRMTPGLNESPSFIQALAGLVRGALST